MSKSPEAVEPIDSRRPQCKPGLVSIILPAYHADRFIAGAIDSVRRQRYTAWELIVVEDGSDGTLRQCVEAFAQEAADHRVVYLRHEKNRGLGATRNTAIEHARGEFLALLDVDDIWLETHLAAALDLLERQQADIAYSTVVKFEDRTDNLLGLWGPSPRELAEFPASLLRRNFLTPSATVLRRSAVDAVGLFDTDPDVHMCEDFDYWLRSIEVGLKFAHLSGCHCLYRKGAPGGGSSNLRQILERHALILQRHFGNAGIPASTWRRHLAYYQMAAGVLNLEQNAHRAGRFFLDGWRTNPVRLDLLFLAILSVTVFRVVSVAPVIRWIKRRKGYAA